VVRIEDRRWRTVDLLSSILYPLSSILYLLSSKRQAPTSLKASSKYRRTLALFASVDMACTSFRSMRLGDRRLVGDRSLGVEYT
jgi:hypothetical protein